MIKAIALDLEGTLISNAISQIPRLGLYVFLERCHLLVERVVIYTTVKEEKFRAIAELLVDEKLAPAWFSNIEYVNLGGKTKDLDSIEGAVSSEVLLVDDCHHYVHPTQESQWVEIKQFEAPYSELDTELNNVLNILKNITSRKSALENT